MPVTSNGETPGQRGPFLSKCWELATPAAPGPLRGGGAANASGSSSDPAAPALPQAGRGSKSPENNSTKRERPQSISEDERQYVFLERLGIADDLGMDTSPGSPAWQIAEREAARASACIPANLVGRSDGAIDAALAAFASVGMPLTYVGVPEGDTQP